jgi:hypothetical protein
MCYMVNSVLDHFPSRFCLVCPDTLQIQYLSSFHERDTKYLEGFFSKDPPSWVTEAWWLWSLLAKPVSDYSHVQAYKPGPNRAATAFIEQLPNELLDQILDYLSESGDRKDMLALGLSSSLLWRLVVHRAQADYARTASVWVGKPVLFSGQANPYERRPHPWSEVLSERHPLTREKLSVYHTLGIVGAMRFDPNAPQTPDMQQHLSRSAGQQWAEALESANGSDWISPAVSDFIHQDLSPAMYPQDRVWILRNLTTCEFIRSDKLEPASHQKDVFESSIPTSTSVKTSSAGRARALLKQGVAAFSRRYRDKQKASAKWTQSINPDLTPLTFAQIFLVLACYSIVPPDDEECLGFQEGRWAGHTFDIVTADVHNAEATAYDWADVSELAVDDVASLRHWAQQMEHWTCSDGDFQCFAPKPIPDEIWQHVSNDRMLYHDWEGRDAQSGKGASRWSVNPVQRGLLAGVKNRPSARQRCSKWVYRVLFHLI